MSEKKEDKEYFEFLQDWMIEISAAQRLFHAKINPTEKSLGQKQVRVSKFIQQVSSKRWKNLEKMNQNLELHAIKSGIIVFKGLLKY